MHGRLRAISRRQLRSLVLHVAATTAPSTSRTLAQLSLDTSAPHRITVTAHANGDYTLLRALPMHTPARGGAHNWPSNPFKILRKSGGRTRTRTLDPLIKSSL